MNTFLMRFEEKAIQEHSIGGEIPSMKSFSENAISTIISGTETFTKVRHESVDTDPGVISLFAFPR
jgi:hypothetical protein